MNKYVEKVSVYALAPLILVVIWIGGMYQNAKETLQQKRKKKCRLHGKLSRR